MLRKILTIPFGIIFLLLALNSLLDGDYGSSFLLGILALWLFSVAFPDGPKDKNSESKKEDKKKALVEYSEIITQNGETKKRTNGPVWRCKKCNSTNMKGASHGYCLHCQHIMHDIMNQRMF